ncbi:MAG: PDZ domain-containing protein [Rubrivivax sp.]
MTTPPDRPPDRRPGPRYRVDVGGARAPRLAVTLTLPSPERRQRLWLPAWVPGSYLVRELARRIDGVTATQRARPCRLRTVDKCTWEVETDGSTAPLVVRYEVLAAADASVRGVMLDDEHGFIDGAGVFLVPEGRAGAPVRLTLAGLPRGWTVATTLPPATPASASKGQRYAAADHAALIDHPLLFGAGLWHGQFEVAGVPHAVVVQGAWPGLDGARLCRDLQRLCTGHVRLWHGARGRPPFQRYAFLILAGDGAASGLEHRDSCALTVPRRALPHAGTPPGPAEGAYAELLSLCSHEYCHAWNVKRLVAAELAAPDLRREAPSRLLWFHEGVSSYLDDLLCARTGVTAPATVLGAWAAHANGVAATPGRHRHSIAQAGFDAWTRLYRPDAQTPNASVSYYAKGALVGLCLDLTLRAAGGSLDGALRRLWRGAFGRNGGIVAAASGLIDENDIAAALAAEAGRSLAPELAAWVHGTDELPLAPLLAGVGVALHATAAPDLSAMLGLRLAESPLGGVHVRHVLRDGAAEAAGVAAGDELLAVNGWRVRRLDEARAWLTAGAPFELLLVREQRVRRCRVRPPAQPAWRTVTLALDPAADAATRARRRHWLGA